MDFEKFKSVFNWFGANSEALLALVAVLCAAGGVIKWISHLKKRASSSAAQPVIEMNQEISEVESSQVIQAVSIEGPVQQIQGVEHKEYGAAREEVGRLKSENASLSAEKKVLERQYAKLKREVELIKAQELAGEEPVPGVDVSERLSGFDFEGIESDNRLLADVYREIARSRERQGENYKEEAAEAYRYVGTLNFFRNIRDAIAALEQSVSLNPNDKDSWNLLGQLRMTNGQYGGAEIALQKFARLSDDGDDQISLSMAFSNLGTVFIQTGDLEKSEHYFLLARDIDLALNREEGLAYVYGNLGIVYEIQGKLDLAKGFYEKALEIDTKLKNEKGIFRHKGNLGKIYRKKQDIKHSIELHEEAIAYYVSLGDEIDIESLQHLQKQYNNLGISYRLAGQFEKAKRAHQRGLNVAGEEDFPSGTAINYHSLGLVYLKCGNYEKAESAITKSLQINQEIGQSEGIANSCLTLGKLNKEFGKFAISLNFFERAIIEYNKMHKWHSVAMCQFHMGEVLLESQSLQKAREIFSRALEHWKREGAKFEFAYTSFLIGKIDAESANKKSACNMWKSAEATLVELGETKLLAEVHSQMKQLGC